MMRWNKIDSMLFCDGLLEEFLTSAEGNRLERASVMALPGAWVGCMEFGSWRVELREESGLARLLHRSGECLVGEESRLFYALKAFLSRKDKERAAQGFGLVLAGGGARGAYEIGVWKALKETGLYNKISCVAGTSVGAINSLLFQLGDWDAGKELWMRMSDPSVRKKEREVIERFTRTYEKRYHRSLFPRVLLEYIENGFITQPELEKQLLALIKSGRSALNQASPAYSTITPEKEFPTLLPAFFTGSKPQRNLCGSPSEHYISWRGLSNMDIVRLIMASAAIPPVYEPINFWNNRYFDGGLYDNVPIWPLLNAGCKRFIVVELRRSGSSWYTPAPLAPHQVCVIRPGDGFADDFASTFDFSMGNTAKLIRRGYDESVRTLEEVARKTQSVVV